MVFEIGVSFDRIGLEQRKGVEKDDSEVVIT